MTQQDSAGPTTYFGLYSPDQHAKVTELLTRLGVQYKSIQVLETEERLRDWTAWDGSSASTRTGYELFIRSADLDLLGTQLVDMFPERKFGAP